MKPGPKKRETLPACSIDGCTNLLTKAYAFGMCSMHYQRVKKTGNPGPPGRLRGKPGDGYIDPDGYRYITRHGHPNAHPNGQIREHVLVMSDMLGRPLLPGENVHHRNGIRHDNRPENLELWVSYQPSGQRPEDLLDWAKTIQARYAGKHPDLGAVEFPQRQNLKWIALDLDQTLAQGAWSPNERGEYIGKPIMHNVEQVRRLSDAGYAIWVHTARPWASYEAVETWMRMYDIPFKGIVCGKLLALAYIDDRAVSAYAEDWLSEVERICNG